MFLSGSRIGAALVGFLLVAGLAGTADGAGHSPNSNRQSPKPAPQPQKPVLKNRQPVSPSSQTTSPSPQTPSPSPTPTPFSLTNGLVIEGIISGEEGVEATLKVDGYPETVRVGDTIQRPGYIVTIRSINATGLTITLEDNKGRTAILGAPPPGINLPAINTGNTKQGQPQSQPKGRKGR